MNEKNYNLAILKPHEKIFFTLVYLLIIHIYSKLFFDSVLPVIPALFFTKKYFFFVKNHLIKRRKNILLMQFKDWLFSLNASLATGYALENAIKESLTDMEGIYGRDSFIYSEIAAMCHKLSINITVEEIFENFADRSGLPDIKMFAEILSLVKRNGGDMMNIIRNTSETISEEIDLKNQINTSVSSMKFELYIMAVFPLVIIVYIDFTQKDFFAPLYHNFSGIAISSLCLGIYFLALFIANKILTIKRRF